MAAQQFHKGPVTASGEVIVGPIQAGLHDRVGGSVFSDQPGTLYIEQSGDNVNWDISSDYPVVANNGTGFSEEVILAYVRIRFENTGASDTTVFRLFARTSAAGSR